MAKIMAEFDTVDKTLSCMVDGKAVADVQEIVMSKGYMDEEKFGCSLLTVREDEAGGMRHITRLVASANGDMIVQEQTKRSDVQSEIERYFAVK